MAGIVLAGGQSRRMGSDKALFDLNGERLIERAIRIAGSVADRVVVVADRADRYAAYGIACVADEQPGAGPLGGIITGLRLAGPGAHIVIACDMPFVRSELLALLATRVAGHEAAVPWINGRPEPLSAAYDARCVALFANLLDNGRRAVYHAIDAIDAIRVPEADLRLVDPALESFLNVNEPGDLERLLAYSGKREGHA